MKKLKKYLILFCVGLLLLSAFFIAGKNISDRVAEHRRRQAFNNLTATVLNRIAEFAVLEYRYSDVMELNRRFMIGGLSTSLVKFSGVIKAGIADISRIGVEWDADKNRVSITLPHSEILDNTVDVSTVKFWDLRRNLFVPISTDLKIQEVTAFKDRVATELELSGFFEDADNRASELVASLYLAFGAEVVIHFAENADTAVGQDNQDTTENR